MQKIRKTNDKTSRKCQKKRFFRHFRQGNFFLKIRFRQILGIAILHYCAKNQKKLMSQSREKLVTDGRTDERTNERTDGRTKVNLKDLRGRSKNHAS